MEQEFYTDIDIAREKRVVIYLFVALVVVFIGLITDTRAIVAAMSIPTNTADPHANCTILDDGYNAAYVCPINQPKTI